VDVLKILTAWDETNFQELIVPEFSVPCRWAGGAQPEAQWGVPTWAGAGRSAGKWQTKRKAR